MENCRPMAQGYLGGEAGSEIFKSSWFGSEFLYNIYFDAYMSTNACRMMN